MRGQNSRSAGGAVAMRSHYAESRESARLSRGPGELEFYRTKELIARFLPRKRCVVLDVGGGPGAYAFWLAKQGHAVHLVDPVRLHVEQVREACDLRKGVRLASATEGDARDLKFKDEFADAVLLLGPLYHLVKERDRVRALAEARRVLKPGGWIFAAAISKFASALDGLFRGFVKDGEFLKILRRDLKTGQHRNPTNHLEYFTTAFFHHPAELEKEFGRAGLEKPRLYGIEGPGWMLPNFGEFWSKTFLRERLLEIVRAVESEPTMVGQSAHVLAVGRKRK